MPGQPDIARSQRVATPGGCLGGPRCRRGRPPTSDTVPFLARPGIDGRSETEPQVRRFFRVLRASLTPPTQPTRLNLRTPPRRMSPGVRYVPTQSGCMTGQGTNAGALRLLRSAVVRWPWVLKPVLGRSAAGTIRHAALKQVLFDRKLTPRNPSEVPGVDVPSQAVNAHTVPCLAYSSRPSHG
jgi:hypothetical protein